MTLHANSLAAYVSSRELRETRQAAILRFLREHGPSTDREIKLGMGFGDMNECRPRISDGVRDGEILEVGTRFDPWSGKTVRVVAASLAAY